MEGRLVRCVSVLMGVLAAFDSGACVARRKRKNKFQNNFSKVNKLKKVKVTGKEPVPLVIKDPVVVEKPSEASLGNQILDGALVLDILAESVMGFKRLFDWSDVDSARLSAKSDLLCDLYKKSIKIDFEKGEEFLDNIGFHTVYIYADRLFDGALTRDFLFSFLDVASDVAISSLTNRMVVKVNDGSVSEGKKYVLRASLVCLCVALFSDAKLDNDEKIIRCFLEACLDAGCVKLDKEGKICKGDGYPLSWKTLTPFRYWGSNGDYDYAGVINKAIKNRLNGGKGGKVNVGGREIKVV